MIGLFAKADGQMALVELEGFAAILHRPGRSGGPIELNGQCGSATSGDGAIFPVGGGKPVLIDFFRSIPSGADCIRSPVMPRAARAVRALKRWGLGALDTSKRSRNHPCKMCDLLVAMSPKPKTLIIGSGALGAGAEPSYEHPNAQVPPFDIDASNHVQLSADAHDLPLIDDSTDCVAVRALLVHLLNPRRVVSETKRVLRMDGPVYAETPLMQQVHENARGFIRFAEPGNRYRFRDFEAVDRGAMSGAGLSLYWPARQFRRAITRSRLLAELLSPPFALAPTLDQFAAPGHALDRANGVHFLGIKRLGTLASLKDVSREYFGSQR